MDEVSRYAQKMEAKLIEKFCTDFHEKMGYYPIVTGRAPDVNVLTLKELKDAFEPFLPLYEGKKISLSSKSRKREIVDLRKMFCYIAKNMKYTLHSIGVELGGRDHTTVIHNILEFNNMIDTNEKFRTEYDLIYQYVLEILNQKKNESSDMGESHQVSDQSKPALLS